MNMEIWSGLTHNNCTIGFLCALLCGILLAYFTFGRSVYNRLFAWHYTKLPNNINLIIEKQKCQAFRFVHEHYKNLKSDFSILDVGSGPGANLAFFPPTKNLVCLEPNKYFKESIENNVKKIGTVSSLEIVCEYAEKMPFQNDQFDVVVCSLVLSSVQDIVKTLSEIKRVLKPGGKLVFCEHTPATEPWTYLLQLVLSPLDRLIYGCHFTRDIAKGLQNAGFSELHIERTQLGEMPVLLVCLKTWLLGVATK